MDKVTVTGAPGGGRVFTPTGSGSNGWYAELSVGTPSGERVLFSPLVFAGRIVFSSYEPANDPCTPGGIQRAYVLRALSGTGALPDDTTPNLGGIEVGAGAAFAPVVGIKNPVASTGTPGDDAGFQTPDPDCPDGDPDCVGDPTDPTNLPGAAGGGRDNWCRTIGLQQPGAWVPIGQLCEGRQAWRQIR
jgi:Tfp pilus tip-associated adhesin PilY1